MKSILILLPVFVSVFFVVGGTHEETWPIASNAGTKTGVAIATEDTSASDTPKAADIAAESDTPKKVPPKTIAEPENLPASAKLDVPFTTQAPYENWNMPFQEACEETSVIMVQYYLEGLVPMQETVRDQIVAITDYEDGHGYAHDLSIKDTARIAEAFYGVKATTYYDDDVTQERIQSLIAQGHPVIIPALGRDLNNPHFTGDGPPYHMIVVIGYDTEGFITHDPGTKFGENYHYTYATIMGAIHDWTGSRDTLENGGKAMLVLTKKD